MSKGLGELPVGLFLMLLALTLTSGMMSINNIGSREATKPASDLSKIVETKTQNQVFHNNYLTTAAELSFQNGSEFAFREQEAGVSWTGADFSGDYDPVQDTEQQCIMGFCFPVFQSNSRIDTMVDFVEEHTNKSFQKYPFTIGGRCTVVNDNFEAQVNEYGGEVYSDVRSIDGSAIVRCENNYMKSQHEYSGNYIVAIDPEDNRFYSMFRDTDSYFHGLFNRLSSQVDSSYRAESGTYCGSVPSSVKDSTERSAVNSANSDVVSAWEDTTSSYISGSLSGQPDVEGINYTRNNLKTYSFTVDRLSHSENFYGDGSSWVTQVGNCPCSGEGCTPPPRLKAVTEVTPKEAKVNWTTRDFKQKIPLPDGWDNLELRVEPYTQDLEQY